MVTFYCPQCWKILDQRDVICSHCGINIERTLGERDYASSLIAALSHSEPETPIRAALILGLLRNREAVIPLLEVVDGDADIYQKRAAIEALATIGDTRAEPTLRRLASEEPQSLRTMAREALLQIRAQTEQTAALLSDQVQGL
jgi:HEAT repeat protein